MTVMTELVVILALDVANGIFAGAEIAVVALRKTRVVELADEGNRRARAVLALRDNPERFLATVQVGITVVSATAAAFGGASIAARIAPALSKLEWIGDEHANGVALGLVVALVSFLSIVIGELVPKSLALRSAERYALLISKPLLGLSWLARPIVWVLSKSANLVLKPFGDETTFTEARHSADELQQLVEEAAKAGTIDAEAGEIAARALELPALTALDVMVPRQDVIMVPRDATANELRHVLLDNTYTRYPVYEGRVDNVVGYIGVKDVLSHCLEGTPAAVEALMRPPFFVPESQRAVELLREMRSRRLPLAIVVDELGGTAGIVTIEDLVEEVVGEIFSEHTQYAPPPIQKQPDGSALVSGIAPIREVNRALGIELSEDGPWTTIAGLALSLAGQIPTVGQTLALPEGITLEVVDASPRRVRTVRVRLPKTDIEDG
jgi:putative hemolysin